jgi:hypothetical protein
VRRTVRGNPNKTKPYRWKKGQPSPNPGGRPRLSPYTDAHRAIAEGLVKDLGIKATDSVAMAVAKVVAREALRGKIPAAKELADRVEGTPTQRHDVNLDDLKVDAKLSTGDLLGAIRAVYGLSEPPANAEGPVASIPASIEVGKERSKKKDSGRE